MIDDGVTSQGGEEDDVRVGDLAMHRLEAIENAEPGAVPAASAGSEATDTTAASSED